MTNRELEVLEEICIMIHEHPSFQLINRDKMMEWVSLQLALALDIIVRPLGSRYLVKQEND